MKRLSLVFAIVTASLILFSCEKDKMPTTSESEPDQAGVQQSPHFQHLKDLSWLVGDWIDDDENIKLQLTYQWDRSKNFLIEHFKMELPDNQQFEGFQVIGWDPSQNRIRSWIFDSEGGFGESKWFDRDDHWLTRTLFTLDDGRKASANHIYSKVDQNTYTFSSQNREVGGVLLPNLGPFKVIRK